MRQADRETEARCRHPAHLEQLLDSVTDGGSHSQQMLDLATFVVNTKERCSLTSTFVGGNPAEVPANKLHLQPFEALTPFQQRIRVLCEREQEDESPLGVAAGLSSATVGNWTKKSSSGARAPGHAGQLLQFVEHYDLSLDWLLSPTKLPKGYQLPARGRPLEESSQLDEAADRFNVHPDMVLILQGDGRLEGLGEKMRELPNDAVRKAVLAIAYAYEVNLERVIQIARSVVQKYRASLDDPEDGESALYWFRHIEVQVKLSPESGSHPKIPILDATTHEGPEPTRGPRLVPPRTHEKRGGEGDGKRQR